MHAPCVMTKSPLRIDAADLQCNRTEACSKEIRADYRNRVPVFFVIAFASRMAQQATENQARKRESNPAPRACFFQTPMHATPPVDLTHRLRGTQGR